MPRTTSQTTATATSPTKPQRQQPRPHIATPPGPRNLDNDVPDPNTHPLPPSRPTTPAQDASATATSPGLTSANKPDDERPAPNACLQLRHYRHVIGFDERQKTQTTTTTTTPTSIQSPPLPPHPLTDTLPGSTSASQPKRQRYDDPPPPSIIRHWG